MMTDHLDRRLRHAVKLEATVTMGDGACHPAQVANLSLDGCCISGVYSIGSLVDLKIRPLGIFRAQVRWAIGGKAGLRFTRGRQSGVASKSVVADNRGVAAIEYCITAAFIAIALIVALTGLGRGVESNFNNVDSAVGGGMDYQTG